MEKKDKNLKVLIVEDDPDILTLLSMRLVKDGYDVATAHDGEEALLRINEIKPDIVFLDLMLPKVNGFEVCHKIKEIDDMKETKIIIISAKNYSADINKAKKLGADVYMTKPFKNGELARALKSVEVNL